MNMLYEILDGQTVINTIVADAEFMQAAYPDGNYREAAQQPAPAQEPRNITVGAFYDRFGELKWAVLADPSASVQALIKDCAVRPYINLDNPQVRTGLQMVVAAGHAIDVDKIVSDPVQPEERP